MESSLAVVAGLKARFVFGVVGLCTVLFAREVLCIPQLRDFWGELYPSTAVVNFIPPHHLTQPIDLLGLRHRVNDVAVADCVANNRTEQGSRELR